MTLLSLWQKGSGSMTLLSLLMRSMPLNVLLFFMRRCFSGGGDERESTYVTMLLSLSQETVMLFRLQRGVS